MSYTSNVPQASQSVSQTQLPILNNFIALAPWGNGYGIFTNQVSAPAVAGNDIGIYNATSAISSLPSLFLKKAAGTPFEFGTSTTATVGDFQESWTQLPSGVIVKWGLKLSNLAAGSNTFTFNATFPAFTAAPVVLVSPQTNISGLDANSFYYIQSTSTTQFQVYAVNRTGSGSVTYYSPMWIAIGV